MSNKPILDACCGGRMMWFDKKNPNCLFVDIREEDKGFIAARPNFCIKPDQIVDFRNMPFTDQSFKLIAWDPPHFLYRGKKSWAAQKYGTLEETWKQDLTKGFNECWRVLEDWGVLILKWSTEAKDSRGISLSDLLKLFHTQPLFGHTSGSKSNTKWMCFMKIPEATK